MPKSIIDINLAEYSYHLPDERIAKYPLKTRDQSKLLIYKKGYVSDDVFKNIDHWLPEDSLMVYNNTRVIPARISFRKTTGAHIEIFCLEPTGQNDYSEVFAQSKSVKWNCMIGNAKKWKSGTLQKKFSLANQEYILEATKTGINEDSFEILFSWKPENISFGELLDKLGKIPIPPYLKRETEHIDHERYQTVYSKSPGSVAAPTAGLHFTDAVFDKLQQKNVVIEPVTLHVGAGTFKPIKSDNVLDHTMHTETFEITRDNLKNLLTHAGNVTAVGTTTVRTLESIYWLGYKLMNDGHSQINELHVPQWCPYKIETALPHVREVLEYLLKYLKRKDAKRLVCTTNIMIVPGYTFQLVNRLITNFHQPNSTLLLLVSAFTNNNWKTIYQYALDHDFRFLSYGDSSLLIP